MTSATSRLLRWCSGDTLDEHELLLYVLLRFNFSERPFHARRADTPVYSSIIKCINHVYGQSYTTQQLYGYLRDSTRKSSGVGKYRGVFRWTTFASQARCVIETCELIVRKVMHGEVVEEDVIELKRVLSNTVLVWLKSVGLQEDVLYDIGLLKAEWNRVKLKHADWRLSEQSNKVFLTCFSEATNRASYEVVLAESLEYEVYLHNRRVDLGEHSWAVPVKAPGDISKLLSDLEDAPVCRGCSYPKYEALVEQRQDQGTFRNHEGEVVAEVEYAGKHPRCIRNSKCSMILSPGKVCCQACLAFDGTLRKDLSRLKHRTEESRVRTPFAHLSHNELVERCRSSSIAKKRDQRQLDRLVEKQKEMIELKNASSFAPMLSDLEQGLSGIKERLDNPRCRWKDCNCVKSDINALISHVTTTHIARQEDSSQLRPVYTCQWEGCSHAPFHKRSHIESHIVTHTGREEDSLFALMMADQAKAVVTPSNQMRWHPVVLRWCLQQHSKSSAQYDRMRDSGFLRLPCGRTLLRYRNFNHPSSGWHDVSLNEQRALFDEFLKNGRGHADRAHYGILIFDEVKIKEGLLWDPRSDELIGFIDYDVKADDDSSSVEKLLATHVLQFQFKSLFSGFIYPCAYFLSSNPASGTIDSLFCKGVEMLYRHGFHVLGVCCDGASSNRSFCNMLADRINPFTKDPFFTFSDPTHIVKKLRNSLAHSGFGRTYSRLLKIDGKYATWDQVKNVFTRDARRTLWCTPLREEHIALNNLTKMRSRLAYDVFDSRVEQEMLRHDADDTVSVRAYLSNVRKIVDVFQSHDRLCDSNDPRLACLQEALDFFVQWKTACSDPKQFMSREAFADLSMTVNALIGLVRFIEKKFAGMGVYVIPSRLNQDCLEQLFGMHRACGGANSNMTAYAYGYQSESLKQTNVVQFNLRDKSRSLPLRQCPQH